MYPSIEIVENMVKSAHHSGCGRQGLRWKLGENATNRSTIHGFRPYKCLFRSIASWNCKDFCQTRKQSNFDQYFDLPCGGRKNGPKKNGKSKLLTFSGGTLTAWMEEKDIYNADENGGKSKVTIMEVFQSYGAIQVMDLFVLPKS